MISLRSVVPILGLSILLLGCGEDEQKATRLAPQATTPSGAVAKAHTSDSAEHLGVLDISEREYGDSNAIAVLFNEKINPDQNFSRFIQTQPELAKPVLSEDSKTLYFTGITPQTDYQIVVSTEVESISGKTLNKAYQKYLKTRELPASVAFEVDGAVMIPGRVTSLPILAVNIPEAQVDVYAVKKGHSVSFFDEYSALKGDDPWYFNEGAFAKTLQHLHSSRIKIDGQKNSRNRAGFAVNKVPGVNEGGLFLATVRAPGSFTYSATWFTVSALGIQARDYGDVTRYTLQNASDGSLLPGVQLNLLDYNNQVIATGVTDAEGAWELPNSIRQKKPALLLAELDGQTSVLKYYAPNFDLSEFAISGRPYRALELLSYSPRDIYRPGEELIISTLVRDGDGQAVDGPINLELYKPDSDKAGTWRLDQTAAGYYEFRYDLAQNSPLGEWRARIFSPGKKADSVFFDFKVEEFLPERLRLIFASEQPDNMLSFRTDDELAVPVTGEYLYGAPAAGNRLETAVTVSSWISPFVHLPGYRFGEQDADQWHQFSLPDVQLDDAGQAVAQIPASMFNWQNFTSPARMRLRYSLYESGGRAINRSQSVLLWPKQSFIGVKPLFEHDRADKGSQAQFELLRANYKGERLNSGEAKATLYRMEEKYFWSYTAERGWHYQIEKNEYPVANRVINFANAEKTPLSFAVEWGKYRLELDDYTATSKTIYHFNAGEEWYNRWNTAADTIRPDQITLALDKGAYKAGEQVKVKIASPTEGKALVLLEAGEVLASQLVELSEGKAETVMTVPDDLARHDAYITAFVIAPSDNSDKVSKRSFGAVHLPLDREDRQLSIKLDLPAQLSPETETDILLQVTDKDGAPASGDYFVTLSAVDAGVLSVTGYTQPDPFAFFYGRRGYQARISDMYDHLAEPTLVDDAEIRWGGDAELERGGDAPPADVQIVSLFSSVIKVKDGQAVVTLDLPAFDGELNLTAIAMGGDKFGYQQEAVKVASPLVIQLATPRFLAQGDRTRVALDLTNMTEQAQQIRLNIAAEEAIALQAQELRLALQPGQKEVLYFDVSAESLGEGQIIAAIHVDENGSNPFSLDRHWGLNVRAAYPATYGATSQLLQQGEQLALPVDAIDLLRADSRKVQLTLAPSPDFNAQQHAEALLQYPYACLEQTTSKAQPLSLLSAGKSDFLANIALTDIELERQVKAIINRYAELQLPSGGFGLWGKHSSEEHWLSVYATERLIRLHQQGFDVPEAMLTAAKNRLRAYVLQKRVGNIRSAAAIPSHYELAYQAYAAYVLAQEGKMTLGPLRDLADKKLSAAHSRLPGVHLGLALLLSGSPAEGEATITQALQKQRTEGYLGDYGSELRDQAVAIAAVLATKGTSSKLRRQAIALLPDLLTDLQRSRWLSTQERATLLQLAAVMSRYKKEGNWSVGLTMGGEQTELEGDSLMRKNIAADVSTETVLKNLSERPVYAGFSWTGVAETISGAVDEGISIQTDHYKVKKGEASLLQKNQVLKMGDVILTRVRLLSNEPVPDGLLVNLLPAGLELENQNLKHAIKLADIRIAGEQLEQGRLLYQEYRDDRYVAAVDLSAKREQTYFFLSRAVTPGDYRVPPTQAESMYKPEVRGLSETLGNLLIIE